MDEKDRKSIGEEFDMRGPEEPMLPTTEPVAKERQPEPQKPGYHPAFYVA